MCTIRLFYRMQLLYNGCWRYNIIRLLTPDIDIWIRRIIETVREKTQMVGSSLLHINNWIFTGAVLRIIMAKTDLWFHMAVCSTWWSKYSPHALLRAVFFYSINFHIIYWRASFKHLLLIYGSYIFCSLMVILLVQNFLEPISRYTDSAAKHNSTAYSGIICSGNDCGSYSYPYRNIVLEYLLIYLPVTGLLYYNRQPILAMISKYHYTIIIWAVVVVIAW